MPKTKQSRRKFKFKNLTMNEKLKNLYESKWPALYNEYSQIYSEKSFESKPTNPYLISVDDDYENSDIKIMIFGQETNGWYEEEDESIRAIQSHYDKWVHKKECFSYGGHFWNGVRILLDRFKERYQNKKISFLSNNIIKIGRSEGKGFPPDYIYEMERVHFDVIKEELKIVQPNVVLFLTGPNYDSVIEDCFGKLEYTALEPFSTRQLASVKIENVDSAFRTYHPNYLFRNDIDSYFDLIIDRVVIS